MTKSAEEQVVLATRTVVHGATIKRETRIRGKYYPFNMELVQPGESKVFRIQRNIDGVLKINRLLIPDSICPHFDITGIAIGFRSQTNLQLPIPAEVFSERSASLDFKFDRVWPGMNFSLVVRNIKTFANIFTAYIIGDE